MTNPMWTTIEEMAVFPNTHFETLSIMSLLHQNMIDLPLDVFQQAMSTDETEYIEVHFRQNIDVDFKKLFIETAVARKIFIQWFKCPSEQCNYHYLVHMRIPNRKLHNFLKIVDAHKNHMKDNDCLFARREVNGAHAIAFEEIFWIKKDKYYDLSPIIRRFVFDKDIIEE